MMQVVDCFLFADELDMLECRLHELEEVVDWFVLVESEHTFQGNPKPLWYDTHRERFARWSDRIVHVVAELPDIDKPFDPQYRRPSYERDPFIREAAQREAIIEGLKALPLTPDDTIVLSDVDEIWRPSIVVTDLPRPFTVLKQTMYVHNLGWQHPDLWDGPVVVHVEDLPPAEYGTFNIVRSCGQHPRPPRVPNAGWHLTYFGGPDAARNKLDSFSHTECAEIDIADYAIRGLHVDGTELIKTGRDADLPRWIPDRWLP